MEDFDEDGGRENKRHPNEPRRPIKNWTKIVEANPDILEDLMEVYDD